MKILALNGSHRGRRGLTQTLLGLMAEGAREGGADFETIVLSEKELKRCIGCESCQSGERPRRCVFDGKDEAQPILNAMRGADIIVFASPIYVFAMSSLLKTLIERVNSECDTRDIRVSRSGLLFHHIDADLCSKPFVLVAPFSNIEKETPRSLIEYFKSYSRFMDAPMLAALPRSGAMLLEEAANAGSAAIPPAMAAALEAFREAGLDLASRGRISAGIVRRAARSVVSMPSPVRALMKIKPLRGRLLAAAKASGALRMGPSGDRGRSAKSP
jgi:NAD(P)H-dependent FMN reductase